MMRNSVLKLTNGYKFCFSNKITKCFTSSYSIVFKSYGDPNKVLEKVETTDQVLTPPLKGNDVIVKFLASTINPADINTIQGVYSIKPELPAVPGNEGCAEVVQVGPEVKSLQKGDRVIPFKNGFGCWRTHARANENLFTKVDASLDEFSASQIKVNPCTAYRMIKDFLPIQKGNSIIQNGANSSVGKNVIQLAKIWGLNTINVIRKRPTDEEHQLLVKELLSLGADVVITDEDLRNAEVMNNIWNSGISKPLLALNCINGKNATDCIRHLNHGGTMVTYGGMSKQPLVIPTGSLIFLDHSYKGFWMTAWYEKNRGTNAEKEMLDFITSNLRSCKLKITTPIPFKFDDFHEAVEASRQENVYGKVTLIP